VSSGVAEPAAGAGTDTGTAGADPAAGTATTGGAASAVDTAAVLEDLERSQLERDELGQRLAAISERLETLERIVELKDSQIAALQQALDQASAAAGTAASGAAPEGRDNESPVAAVPTTSTAEAPRGEPEPPAAPISESGNWLYILAAAVVAGLLALVFWRRRRQDDEELAAEDMVIPVAAAPLPASRTQRDAFADVQLQDQALEVDHSEEQTPLKPEPVEEAPVVAAASQRGYGERKHDQYASDVDAGDALAEADIYIAYGRFPQAMELLRKAVAADPDNSAYRLKLLELAVETGERDEASQQLAQLQRIGDDDSVARAQALMSGAGGLAAGASAAVEHDRQAVADPAADTQSYLAPESAADPEAPDLSSPAADLSAPDLSEYSGNLSDFDEADETDPEEDYDLSEALADLQPRSGDGRDELVPAIDESPEPEFLDLEIEDSPVEELDVSTEFERGDKGGGDYGEDDFVFADDGDPLSTKLDLARAYIDMGDQDGAREILEEVAAEGSDEQQAEARTLMDRFV
jgi:pilus assembly protein FimV